jgi:hypothetical protein
MGLYWTRTKAHHNIKLNLRDRGLGLDYVMLGQDKLRH